MFAEVYLMNGYDSTQVHYTANKMKRTLKIMRAVVIVGVGTILGTPITASADDLHHVHVTASNATEAVKWYTQYLPCESLSDRADGVDCGGTEIVFVARPTRGSSQRTGIDHIAFSYADLRTKMTEIESAGVGGRGVRLQRFEDGSTLRETPGLVRHGFIFDPWGTRIELVEDTEHLGFHHVHLSGTDPDATLAWYADVFGGERGHLGNQLEGLKFGDTWLLSSQSEEGMPAPTAGRSIDHLAFESTDFDRTETILRRHGAEFSSEPETPLGGRTTAKRTFVGGPDNVNLAVVEPGFAGVESTVSTTTEAIDVEPYVVARTPWGTPDLQGIWTGDAAHGIPLERNPEDIGKEELTVEEALARRESGTLGSIWGYESEWRDTTLGYVKSDPLRQVAMVIDPPEGQLPSLTPQAQEPRTRIAVPAGPEDMSPWVRCITRGPVPMPQVYNNGLQIMQGPGFVAVQREMIHETRIIPTNGQPNLGSKVTSYLGDASGHWENDTLVVESRNFNGNAPFRRGGGFGSGYGASASLTLTERYTRTSPNTLEYQFTFDDPETWTQPWTGSFTFVRDDSQYELVEYACHEGNYGMFNILTGARFRDRESDISDK